MTTRIKRIITTIHDGAAVAEAHAEAQVNGQWWPLDPVPLATAGPEWDSWKETFGAAALAQRDQLQLDNQSLQSQVDSLTSERDSLQLQLDQSTTENAALQSSVQSLTGDRDSLASQLAAVTSERDTQAQRIVEIESQLDALLHPPGPDLTTRDGVRQFVANARYAAETGGIRVGDQFISTERDEIGHWFPRFYNALMWLQGDPRIRAVNPDGHYPFKPKGHPPTVLTAEQVLRVYECMAWFINACFAAEAVLYGRLDANEPLDVIVTETPNAWPSNQFAWEAPAQA